ncbi:MAG: hypothetical protein H7Y36_09300, partial [Armatimonadetes bacterium]|nr:hypothetical protein [Akkermansiaceae bacterium]
MLTLLVALPILAFIAILLGSPARQTAIGVAALNFILGFASVFSWDDEIWNFSLRILDRPALHLSFGYMDGMSVVMVLLSVIVALAAVLSGKAPQGNEKLYYGSSLLIAAGA